MGVWSCCELRETRGILAPRRLTHEKEEEGEKEQEEDLVLVEVVEHSWEVELVLVLVLVEVVEHSWEV